MAQTMLHPALAFLDRAAPLPVTAEIALRVAVVLAQWSQRNRTRKALAQLDDHLLHDVGLSRAEAGLEAVKPFWRG
ncbi:DUF1127 domain-containing protein [Thetidibacter halocola]|uniref:DUF1127 domain-containing protein n=1 Tax=Thetidibacter halocola TaxID=2827239 RepID=A0A8J8B5H7_9RHOB|nr:DUF1127 domain-containing protein [Thetidibacter halocola]MBS0122956.1 DUF1127 domain-containing protein [Thetidibacter halocola]